MLSAEENELLCHVGPGTPMGTVFRRYWLPALRSVDLPAPDCTPVRVRLLGEDLIAFRDSSGRVGLLAERCSHRGTSLFFGRNEEGGLRCIYHGWKYDVDGRILDTPAEPAQSMIKHAVRHPCYPCREINSMVYTYMGPPEKMPLLPDLPWFTLPADRVGVGAPVINECTWLQTQEGNLDSTHSAFLHARRAMDGAFRPGGNSTQPYRNQQNPPAFEINALPWGVRAVIRYPAADGKAFTRINTFVAPVYTALPNGPLVEGKLDGFDINTEVPMDDEHTMRYTINVRYTSPTVQGSRVFPPDQVAPDGRKLRNRANDYLIDREKQRQGLVFSGLDALFPIQDACACETMGPIADRSHEHLGVGDTQIAAVRRFLLAAIRTIEQGGDAPGVAFDAQANDYSDLITINAEVPAGVDWKEFAPEVTTRGLPALR